MFYDCSSLEKIILTNKFNTSQVTNMECMFGGCHNLISLDLSNFDTSNVTDMNKMFINCSSLKKIKLTNKFNTSQVTNMNSMFRYCKNLISLDLSNFVYPDSIDMKYMFVYCSSLQEIQGLENFYYIHYSPDMFAGCENLKINGIESRCCILY